jgi:ABC-type xylose transport system permease subunit
MISHMRRRRFLRDALIAGAGFTSATLLANQSAVAAEGPSGKMISTKGMRVGVVLETLSRPQRSSCATSASARSRRSFWDARWAHRRPHQRRRNHPSQYRSVHHHASHAQCGSRVVYIISNQYNVDIPENSSSLMLGRGHLGLIPISILVFAALFAAAWLLERRTTIGRSIHALGGNQAAARLCGVPLVSIRTATYAISGACAALAGVILTSQVGLAVPYQGTGYELDVIAAVVVGGVSLTGGIGNIVVGALGSIFIGVLLNGMALINVPAIW